MAELMAPETLKNQLMELVGQRPGLSYMELRQGKVTVRGVQHQLLAKDSLSLTTALQKLKQTGFLLGIEVQTELGSDELYFMPEQVGHVTRVVRSARRIFRDISDSFQEKLLSRELLVDGSAVVEKRLPPHNLSSYLLYCSLERDAFGPTRTTRWYVQDFDAEGWTRLEAAKSLGQGDVDLHLLATNAPSHDYLKVQATLKRKPMNEERLQGGADKTERYAGRIAQRFLEVSEKTVFLETIAHALTNLSEDQAELTGMLEDVAAFPKWAARYPSIIGPLVNEFYTAVAKLDPLKIPKDKKTRNEHMEYVTYLSRRAHSMLKV